MKDKIKLYNFNLGLYYVIPLYSVIGFFLVSDYSCRSADEIIYGVGRGLPAALFCCCPTKELQQIQILLHDGTALTNFLPSRNDIGMTSPITAKNATATIEKHQKATCIRLQFHSFFERRDSLSYLCACRLLAADDAVNHYFEYTTTFNFDTVPIFSDTPLQGIYPFVTTL